jgi:hypothetical protein
MLTGNKQQIKNEVDEYYYLNGRVTGGLNANLQQFDHYHHDHGCGYRIANPRKQVYPPSNIALWTQQPDATGKGNGKPSPQRIALREDAVATYQYPEH